MKSHHEELDAHNEVLCDKFSYCSFRMSTDYELPCAEKNYYGCKFYDALRRHCEQEKGQINEDVWKKW